MLHTAFYLQSTTWKMALSQYVMYEWFKKAKSNQDGKWKIKGLVWHQFNMASVLSWSLLSLG